MRGWRRNTGAGRPRSSRPRLAGRAFATIVAASLLLWAGAAWAAPDGHILAFLAKYPAADANQDGTLTPSEVWLFRSKQKTGKRGRSPALRDAQRALSAMYTPARADASKRYGPQPGKKLKVFILSGQSNMVGQGLSAELPDALKRPDERVLMFEEGRWQPLRPLRVTFGPEIAFAHALAKAWPEETIGVVKQAVGGTGILAWSPTWTKEKADLTGDGKKGNLWKALCDKVRRAREAADCEILGFVWQQGGKDMSKIETGKQYLAHLRELIEGLRKETGVADLPLVLGSYRLPGVPDDLSNIDPAAFEVMGRPGAGYVLQAQFDAQEELAPAKMLPLRGLERHPKNVHYNTKGQLELGKLFAEGYLELVKANPAARTETATQSP